MLRLSLFPYCKVIRGFFVALSVKAAGALERVVEIASAQNTVVVVGVVFCNVEIYASV